jgi:protein-disulfide isomerase
MPALRPPLLAALASGLLLGGCNDFPVEHCVAGQGVGLDSAAAPVLGRADAPVELVLFGDMQCPYTRSALWTVLGYLDGLATGADGDRVQLRFRHFPLESIHPRARAAALALAAAHDQGGAPFWRLLRLLVFAEDLADETLRALAGQAGLDLEAWDAVRAGPAAAAVVDRDLSAAAELALPGTPSFLLCGVPASYDPEEVIANIDAIIER